MKHQIKIKVGEVEQEVGFIEAEMELYTRPDLVAKAIAEALVDMSKYGPVATTQIDDEGEIYEVYVEK